MLDAVDAVLVRELQRDGRATFQALADRVGLSRTAVRARVQHLLEAGVVRVIGVVHSAIVGTQAIGHLWVTVEGAARKVATAVAERPRVRFVSLTTGSVPLVAEVRTRDDGALAAEADVMRRIPGVRSVEVFRSLSVIKDVHSVVGELGDVHLDDVDWRLLRELQLDGRAPYTRLAKIVGLSQAATRARVVRLMQTGVIRVTALVDPSALGSGELAGFGLGAHADVRRAAEEVAKLDGVHYVVTGFGRHDLIGQAKATSRGELVDILDAVRALPGVTMRESWHHLHIVKDLTVAQLPRRRR